MHRSSVQNLQSTPHSFLFVSGKQSGNLLPALLKVLRLEKMAVMSAGIKRIPAP
ncbi:MAG: hypothetical protein KHF84_07430 [Thermoplasmata archaeon]|jgi:hypothetical protein|nr:hypothetical protein [Candidatus Sysuiplasma jiujiangense]